MLRRFHHLTHCLLACLLAVGSTATFADPLPSWRDGATKRAITAFVADVTQPESKRFVPERERLASIGFQKV